MWGDRYVFRYRAEETRLREWVVWAGERDIDPEETLGRWTLITREWQELERRMEQTLQALERGDFEHA